MLKYRVNGSQKINSQFVYRTRVLTRMLLIYHYEIANWYAIVSKVVFHKRSVYSILKLITYELVYNLVC